MKDYKRWTTKNKNGSYIVGTKDINNVIVAFGELEDKIEQGLMIELPCKVGETVYRVLPRCEYINKCSEFDQHVCSRKSCDAFIRKEKFAIHILNRIGDDFCVTEPEAKVKLAELKGKKCL